MILAFRPSLMAYMSPLPKSLYTRVCAHCCRCCLYYIYYFLLKGVWGKLFFCFVFPQVTQMTLCCCLCFPEKHYWEHKRCFVFLLCSLLCLLRKHYRKHKECILHSLCRSPVRSREALCSLNFPLQTQVTSLIWGLRSQDTGSQYPSSRASCGYAIRSE